MKISTLLKLSLIFSSYTLALSANAYTCNFQMLIPGKQWKVVKSYWRHIHKSYNIKVITKATTDSVPNMTRTKTKIYDTDYGYYYHSFWADCISFDYMTKNIPQDKNGIVHVKISIIPQRSGFDATHPEVVYLDVKNNKQALITDISTGKWRSSYKKYQKNVLYYLADDDKKHPNKPHKKPHKKHYS